MSWKANGSNIPVWMISILMLTLPPAPIVLYRTDVTYLSPLAVDESLDE